MILTQFTEKLLHNHHVSKKIPKIIISILLSVFIIGFSALSPILFGLSSFYRNKVFLKIPMSFFIALLSLRFSMGDKTAKTLAKISILVNSILLLIEIYLIGFGKPLIGVRIRPSPLKKFSAKSSPHWSKFNGIFEILKECFVSVHGFILLPYRYAQLFIRITNVFYRIAFEIFSRFYELGYNC